MRHDLELEDGDLLQQALQLVRVLERGNFDQQAVGADFGDDRFGNAQRVDAFLNDKLDLILNVGRDRRHFRRRLQLEQDARAALKVEAQVDLLRDGPNRPHAESDESHKEDRFERPLELIPHTGSGEGENLRMVAWGPNSVKRRCGRPDHRAGVGTLGGRLYD